jgi:hypothetical protein
MKRKKNNLFQKIALGLIFSLGFFALFNILGTAKAEETAEEQQITEEENIEDINFEGINTTEEITSEEETTPGEESNRIEEMKYIFSSPAILFSEDGFKDSSIVMANVIIGNTKIISQDKNKLKISFDIVNDNSWIQTNVGYQVALSPLENYADLFSSVPDEKIRVEECAVTNKIYSEMLSLKGNARKNKVIEYEAPAYLTGDYLLSVNAFLPSLPSDLALSGELLIDNPISLGGNNQFIEIVPSSCQLFTETQEEENNTSQKEGQVAICEAINHFKEPINATPYFEIYRRSQYGEKIKEFISNRGEFYFEPGEKQNIALDLPVNFDSQAYTAKVVLKKDEEVISNQVVIDYILEGSSATIQNVNFDKESYKQGETAKVKLFWSDAPKLFEERAYIEYLQAELIFKDGETSQICGQVTKDLDVEKNYEEIPITIEKNCPNPIILASLKNKEGKILFQQESQILEEKDSDSSSRNEKNVLEDKNYILIFTLIAISAVALIIFLILFIKMNKRKK